MYFVARQVGYKRGNTRNNVFQLAMQQCCETSFDGPRAVLGSPSFPRLWTGLNDR